MNYMSQELYYKGNYFGNKELNYKVKSHLKNQFFKAFK